ncbi:NAD-dependent deacylase [Lacimicrobium alkaliphilum]|uniref:NAD-dependent protein deacylase n=1 Tax=Lacimicrobium alkaliphilum TaxID=1526571 RepID=A0ABQ1QZB4_9ALTE|nr:NAD-dependent deacylase [Lacimicrobium alkaliphilum]GGD52734.1 NAD-dependent protein deacylase [Lacimicrobium alkaliphilum]
MGEYRNIVVLTGAGISAESGLKTFRDNNGLWEKHRVEEVATPEAFEANPTLVYQFYNQRRAQLKDSAITPNPAHLALADLEKAWKGSFLLVTQNVDDLHQRSGSVNVVPMHGQLNQARCLNSGNVSDISGVGVIDARTLCSCCNPQSAMRPDIVWFGEIPQQMGRIEQALSQADIFVSIGTSGQVYPAAGFAALASEKGAHTVELNLEQTSGSFHQGFYGPASDIVPEFVARLLGDKDVE